MDKQLESLLREGERLLSGGDPEGAARCFERARQAAPESAVAHDALGRAFHALDRVDAAWECFHEAIALDPDLAEAHNNLGVAFRDRGRYVEAEACFERALALKPDFAAVRVNLGAALRSQKRLTEAIACYRRAVDADPASRDGWLNLGSTLSEDGQIAEALACLERLLALDPDDFAARWELCFARLPVMYASADQIAEAREAYARDLAELDQALCKNPAALTSRKIESVVGLSQPFYLAYQGRNDCELQRRYGNLVARLMEQWGREAGVDGMRGRPGKAGARVRVGIVSAEIRTHSVWHAITKGIVTHLSRGRFELYAYHTHRTRDAETAAAEPRFERFVHGPLPLRTWVDEIRRDCPDVILYPEIGMDPMCVRLAAMRLAPVQITAWGHPDTSGLPTIDYFLSAELLEPEGAQMHYTERLVRLAGLGCCPSLPIVRAARVSCRSLGIPGDGAVRFIACQSLFKYLPQYDDVFPRIALRAGKCRFVFVAANSAHWTGPFRLRLEAAFARHGLRFEDWGVVVDQLPPPQFLGMLREMDVYLDTIGFSGFNTALLALESRLPVVTVEGEFMRGRLASAILRRIGVTETIAASADDYVEIAVTLARDKRLRKSLAERIRAGLPGIYADVEPVRSLERVLESMVGGNAGKDR